MGYREQIPIDHGFDHTLALLLEGYQYISNRRKKFGRDIFETRILGGQKAVCIAGEDAAMVFYDQEKFIRQGVAPKRIRQSLFGEKSVQTLDDEQHRHRKQLLMGLMTEQRIEDIKNLARDEWLHAIKKWESMDEVILYDEVTLLLTGVACKWAGVPIDRNEVKTCANQLVALFDSAAAIGPRHWQGRRARNQLEKWLSQLVEIVRDQQLHISENTALYQIAMHRDLQGNLLESRVGAVEVINILRPIVAIAVYITFSVLALYQFPQQRNELVSGDEHDYQMFVQEVRRYYPFFPFISARVRDDFLWKGHDFKKGTLVLLDVCGTNHHPDVWERPADFNPKRFEDWEGGLFDLIPQGGGDFVQDHRCPGEWITIELMKVSLDVFINHMTYEIPKQNLTYSMIRIPSIPKSRMILRNVKGVLS